MQNSNMKQLNSQSSFICVSVLKTEWENLLRRVKSHSTIENQRRLQVEPPRFIRESDPYFQEIKKLFDGYESTRWNTNDILKNNFKFDEKLEKLFPQNLIFPSTYEENETRLYFRDLRGSLENMEKEIEKTIVLLNDLSLQISVSQKEKEELKSLEETIDREISPLLPDYASDLKESINYFKKGYLLGSALIAGRIISVCLDKVNSKIPEDKRKNWEGLPKKEKSEKWWRETRKILNIGTKEEHIIKGIRKYRDTFSHEIASHPSIEELILILSGAVFLTKKIIELNL